MEARLLPPLLPLSLFILCKALILYLTALFTLTLGTYAYTFLYYLTFSFSLNDMIKEQKRRIMSSYFNVIMLLSYVVQHGP